MGYADERRSLLAASQIRFASAMDALPETLTARISSELGYLEATKK
jgi:hypothetical protein